MNPQPPQNDPKNIWKNQKKEGRTMSVEEVRLKARKYLAKSRRDSVAGLVFHLIAIVFLAVVAATVASTFARVVSGFALFMMLANIIRGLYFSFKTYGVIWPSPALGHDVALKTCLEFYRNELERQRQMATQPGWQLAVAFLVIGWLSRDAMARMRPELLSVLIPYVLFAAAGLVALLAVRKFESRRIQAELDALDRFEEENH